jgi:hypothetical protein
VAKLANNSDNGQGNIELVRWDPFKNNKAILPFKEDEPPNSVYAEILPPSAPGDQTVPAKSADHQLSSGKFKGVFRQTGYEHQTSYTNPRAVASTLYSVVRIAQQQLGNAEKVTNHEDNGLYSTGYWSFNVVNVKCM